MLDRQSEREIEGGRKRATTQVRGVGEGENREASFIMSSDKRDGRKKRYL